MRKEGSAISTADQVSGGAERFRVTPATVPPDRTLRADDGWIRMEVRWLITAETVGAERTVVGRTVLQPGSKHDIHRHPNAEEWEYVVSGIAVKHIGDDSVRLEAGDVVFVPAGVFQAALASESSLARSFSRSHIDVPRGESPRRTSGWPVISQNFRPANPLPRRTLPLRHLRLREGRRFVGEIPDAADAEERQDSENHQRADGEKHRVQ
jgi:uncharacterized RmlC-like cupin family protein